MGYQIGSFEQQATEGNVGSIGANNRDYSISDLQNAQVGTGNNLPYQGTIAKQYGQSQGFGNGDMIENRQGNGGVLNNNNNNKKNKNSGLLNNNNNNKKNKNSGPINSLTGDDGLVAGVTGMLTDTTSALIDLTPLAATSILETGSELASSNGDQVTKGMINGFSALMPSPNGGGYRRSLAKKVAKAATKGVKKTAKTAAKGKKKTTKKAGKGVKKTAKAAAKIVHHLRKLFVDVEDVQRSQGGHRNLQYATESLARAASRASNALRRSSNVASNTAARNNQRSQTSYKNNNYGGQNYGSQYRGGNNNNNRRGNRNLQQKSATEYAVDGIARGASRAIPAMVKHVGPGLARGAEAVVTHGGNAMHTAVDQTVTHGAQGVARGTEAVVT